MRKRVAYFFERSFNMDLRKSVNMAKMLWKQNSRSILTIGSVVLTISSVVEAIHATSLAKDIIDDAEYEKFEELGCPEETNVDYKLTTSEIIKHTWKCYIWTILLLSGAVACGVVSHIQSNKRIEAATVAYGSLLETYNAYRDNVQKIVKDKDVRAINHAVVHDMVEQDKKLIPDQIQNSMFADSEENTLVLFRDAYSAKGIGGYFMRTSSDIMRAELEFNTKLMNDGVATLNDWYDCLDIGHSEIGDYYGWRYDDGGPLYSVTIPDDFNVTRDKRNVTCLGLGYNRYTTFYERPKPVY
jgi:hypothetical protein